jgi:hypothetical protein
MAINKLSGIASEMKLCFDRWDRSIQSGFQPVTIQDLDFWIKEIQEVILRGEEAKEKEIQEVILRGEEAKEVLNMKMREIK